MAKRITSSSANWSLIADRLGEKNKGRFLAFKGKSDKYLRMVVGQPAELPKIDFSQYKNKISIPGLVDTFQKGYESFKVPFPSDSGFLAKLDQEEKISLQKAEKMEEDTKKQIVEFKEKLKKLEAMLPYSEMSVEEFFLAVPENKIDPDNPRLWPQFIDRDLPDNPPPGPFH